jgi:hypothetical protein
MLTTTFKLAGGPLEFHLSLLMFFDLFDLFESKRQFRYIGWAGPAVLVNLLARQSLTKDRPRELKTLDLRKAEAMPCRVTKRAEK